MKIPRSSLILSLFQSADAVHCPFLSFFQSYFVTYERFVQWLDWLQDQNNTKWNNKKGTVGAVAVDASGSRDSGGVQMSVARQ